MCSRKDSTMKAPSNDTQWYLIQTKPRQELRAEEHLRRQHFECYLPQKSTDGTTREPLFPGYLFIHLDRHQDNWYPIRSTRGVARVVAFGGEPTPVQDGLIEQLRQRLAQQEKSASQSFQPGERVQIRGEGFEEIVAIFLSNDGQHRAVILLNLLQRQQRVRVPKHYLNCCSACREG